LYWVICFGQHWDDSPLTLKGYEIAKNKAHLLNKDGYKPTHIYTSPYTRTLSTSTEIKSVFTNCEIVIEPLIAEFQPRRKDCTNLYPHGIPTIFNGAETEFSFPESYDNFAKRVRFIIFKLLEKHDTDIMIVTHGEVLKVFINYLQNTFPDIIINPGKIPYLTTLSFKFDKQLGTIIDDSICLE
jgi:broad specificity phosphatase PhoE